MGWRLELQEGGQVALSKAASDGGRRHRLTVYGNAMQASWPGSRGELPPDAVVNVRNVLVDVVLLLTDHELAQLAEEAARRARL